MRHRLSIRQLWSAVILIAGANSICAQERITSDVLAVSRTRPSVGNIHTEKTSIPANTLLNADKGKKINGMGTGIIIDERGYMVTNYHVIADVDAIRVDIEDESRNKVAYTARKVRVDKEHDLAIIKIDANSSKPFKVMPCGTSSDLMLCERVIAIGNAFGYDGTVTTGIISALGRDVEANETVSYKNLIQTDAAINPGNSGGPLINIRGEVIGINVAIRANSQKIGFAIPIDDARKHIAKMMSIEVMDNTFHGAITKDVQVNRDIESGPMRMLVIDGHYPESPAAIAGLRAGDIVTRAAGIDVFDTVDFERALLGRRIGDNIEITVKRHEKMETTLLALSQSPSGRASFNEVQLKPRANNDETDRFWSQLGIRLIKLAPSEKTQLAGTRHKEGMRIIDVKADGPAHQGGIRKGDILVGMEKWETASVDNIIWILDRFGSQQIATETPNQLKFLIVRNKEERVGSIQVAQTPRTALNGN